MLEEQILEEENIEKELPKPLFTRSRILLLIMAFILFSIPLVYRNFEYLLR